MNLKQLEAQYKSSQDKWKNNIKQEPNKHKRFWKWVWYLLAFPFVWLFYNIRDWRTLIIFVIVFLAVSIEVWLPYLLAIITWGSAFSKWCIGIASACWIFWLGPGTPFLPLCIFLTIAIKGLINKIGGKKSEN